MMSNKDFTFSALDNHFLINFFSKFVSMEDYLALSLTCARFHKLIYKERGVCDIKLFNISPLLQIKENKLQTIMFHEQVVKAKKQFMVSCGEDHTIIAVRDQVFTFGAGESGQLGFGDDKSSQEARLVPMPQDLSIKSVVGGGKHTIILTECGQIYGFGDNTFGALGPNLPFTKVLSPTNIQFCNSPISMISCSRNYTAIVLDDEFGTVIILSNTTGMYFETEPFEDTNFEKLKRSSLSHSTRITDVSAGFKHLLLKSSKGKAFAVGCNTDGQLGISTTSTVEKEPVKINIPGKVAQVAAGELHSLLLTTNGTLFAWGNGRKGQLGNGKFNIERSPIQVKLPNQCFPVNITCGNSHSVILDIKANVLTCGANEFGQTAALSNFFQINRPSIVRSGQFKKNLQRRKLFHVAAGKSHTAVLGKAATLFMFGRTEHCGGGGFIRQHSHRTTPIKVTLHGCVSTLKETTAYYGIRYRKWGIH